MVAGLAAHCWAAIQIGVIISDYAVFALANLRFLLSSLINEEISQEIDGLHPRRQSLYDAGFI